MSRALLEVRVVGLGLTVYRVADPGWRWEWNRYGHVRIGIALVTGPICWGLQWRRP